MTDVTVTGDNEVTVEVGSGVVSNLSNFDVTGLQDGELVRWDNAAGQLERLDLSAAAEDDLVGLTAAGIPKIVAKDTYLASEAWVDITKGANAVVGDNATPVDDSAALQANADEARDNNKTLYLPPGNYYHASNLTLQCSVFAHPLAVLHSDASVGVQIGTPSAAVSSKRMILPQIRRRGANGGLGLKLVNVDNCDIFLPHVGGWDDGIGLDGDGNGVAYNNIYVLIAINYMRNLVAMPINSGWASSNNIYGGRWTFTDAGSRGTEVAGTRHVQLGDGTSFAISNNTFYGCSLEGELPEYHVECYGKENRWIECRWEAPATGGARVRWGDDGVGTNYAYGNVIDGGHLASDIVQSLAPYARRNYIRTPQGVRTGWGSSAPSGEAVAQWRTSGSGLIAELLANGVWKLDPAPQADTSATDNDQDAIWLDNSGAGTAGSYGSGIGASAAGVPSRRVAAIVPFQPLNDTDSGGWVFLVNGTSGAGPLIEALRVEADAAGTTAKAVVPDQLRYDSATGPLDMSGSGSPEGSVAAPVGSTYRRTDGGASTSFYVKESGAGNTGWVGK